MNWKSARVFVTGHTGFKGSWLSEWLLALGAEVHGYSLAPATTPALFDQLDLARRIKSHVLGDIRDRAMLSDAIHAAQPNFIFHMAAQPLVRRSYAEPVETFVVNSIGTAHVLDAARKLEKRCVLIVVTTDKCYENKEWLHSYRESDPLGGYDPYSASKACAELVTDAYRRSFFGNGDPIAVASVRAGNVIGGGDWATDRIIPDCIRALAHNDVIRVRNPNATRPWQHVLEPIGGYLLLATRLAEAQQKGDHAAIQQLAGAFNFGPALESNRTVGELVEGVVKHWRGTWEIGRDSQDPHEAGRLMLAIDKAHHLLGWKPLWSFNESVARTTLWYQRCNSDVSAVRSITIAQISEYMAASRLVS